MVFCVPFKLLCFKNTVKLTNNTLKYDILKAGRMAWYVRAFYLEAWKPRFKFPAPTLMVGHGHTSFKYYVYVERGRKIMRLAGS